MKRRRPGSGTGAAWAGWGSSTPVAARDDGAAGRIALAGSCWCSCWRWQSSERAGGRGAVVVFWRWIRTMGERAEVNVRSRGSSARHSGHGVGLAADDAKGPRRARYTMMLSTWTSVHCCHWGIARTRTLRSVQPVDNGTAKVQVSGAGASRQRSPPIGLAAHPRPSKHSRSPWGRS